MAKGDFGRWMQEAQRRVTEWSRGRYGTDRLSMAVMNVAVLLVVVDVVARTRWLSVIAMLLLAYAWFRITSKDIAARAAENARAMRAAGPVLSWLANPVAEAREARAGSGFEFRAARGRCASPAPAAMRDSRGRRRDADGVSRRGHRLG